MRRQPRSESRRIVQKLRQARSKAEAALAAEIGSRVFPLRAPPASMPSSGGGRRRSTTVFVPKSRDAPSRAKQRVSLSKRRGEAVGDEWLHAFGSSGAGNAAWWNSDARKLGLGVGVGWNDLGLSGVKEQPSPPEPVQPMARPQGKMFGIVYSRKRRRSPADDSAAPSLPKDDQKYRIVYSRKRPQKRLKADDSEGLRTGGPAVEPGVGENEDGTVAMVIAESASSFAENGASILEEDISTRPNVPIELVVLVESSSSGGSRCFAGILASVLSWMGRRGARLPSLANILFSGSIASFFSMHGIHFSPLSQQKLTDVSENAVPGSGVCKLYGGWKLVPLLTVDFSAVPHFFMSLHSAMFLASQYLSAVLASHLMESTRSEERDSTGQIIVYVTPAATNKLSSTAKVPTPVAQSIVKPRNPQKKRSKLRSRVDRKSVLVSLPASSSPLHNLLVATGPEKPLDPCRGNMGSIREDCEFPSPSGPPSKYKKIEGTKELRLALSQVRERIDSVRCKANILVTNSDRCWREEHAEIVLETSGSKEWCLAVKAQGTTRYLYKPQEWRPCIVNRYTHAYMWVADDSWRFEFFDRWDWLVFKELHTECRERNRQDLPVKVIPIPGVQVVSEYDGIAASSFIRPGIYIHMMGDEVERALSSNTPNYDLDSEDEEWLNQLNTGTSNSECGEDHISEENFEKIVFTLEKDFYNNSDDTPNKERALDLCQDLGKMDSVAAVFDYWLKKRNKKRASLVKVFQCWREKKAQFLTKPILRRKRSVSRQRSHNGRAKPDSFLQDGTKEQEAKQKNQEREASVSEAVQKAIALRSRAQAYMSNAELAAYKSVMALRIAEAKQVSESLDFVSSLLE